MRNVRGCQLGRDRYVRVETHAKKPLAEKLPRNYYHETKINMKNSKNYKQTTNQQRTRSQYSIKQAINSSLNTLRFISPKKNKK